ncbi:hypothetical protein [Salipiger sp.]|uniref:hypothetical protein n=1 Tax=Salipiger sp. TaxID=2078585 RepID=UPI003A978F5D
MSNYRLSAAHIAALDLLDQCPIPGAESRVTPEMAAAFAQGIASAGDPNPRASVSFSLGSFWGHRIP